MNVEATALPGVLSLTRTVRGDSRGSFSEIWHRDRYANAALPTEWVQDNVSHSELGVLRGLHFQYPLGQGKLVSALHGTILDLAVDVRWGSPTFGKSVAVELSAESGRQLWIPSGFAHGFLVVSSSAVVHYKCTAYYSPRSEQTLLWNDPALDVPWPRADVILSPKDAAGRRLSEFAPSELPPYALE